MPFWYTDVISLEATERQWEHQYGKQKRHGIEVVIGVFVIVNVALWAIWALNDRDQPGVPWPVYVTVVWGAILAFMV